jgi:hypothetical protein
MAFSLVGVQQRAPQGAFQKGLPRFIGDRAFDCQACGIGAPGTGGLYIRPAMRQNQVVWSGLDRWKERGENAMAQPIVHGQLTDLVSGRSVADTEDERLRQRIARRLLTECGYSRQEVRSRLRVPIVAGEKRAEVILDFLVSLEGVPAMMIRYGPGSIVTRHRPTLALARLMGPNSVPVVVVTNGRDADILESGRGRIIGSGLAAILTREALEGLLAGTPAVAVDGRQAEMAARIVYAFEIDGSCCLDAHPGPSSTAADNDGR